MKSIARNGIMRVVIASIVYMIAGLMLEMATRVLPNENVAMFSLVFLGVALVLTAALVVVEVRAYRSVVSSCGEWFTVSDKVLLAAALWFFGGLPTAIISMIRCSVWGGEGDMKMLLIQVGLSVSLCLLSGLKVREALQHA